MGRIVGAEKKLEGRITFSRPQGRDEDSVKIVIEDDTSGVQFAEIRLSLAHFTAALMGLAFTECELKVNGLEVVGKTREYMRERVFISDDEYKKATENTGWGGRGEALAQWLNENHAREGWSIDGYLGSQGSVVHCDGGQMLTFGYYRYVEKTDS